MATTGMKWNGRTWLMEWDGVLLTEEQDLWLRRGLEAEAQERTKVRKASPKKVAELMDCLEAMEEHWEPQTPGDLLTRIVRIYVTELTPQDRAEIIEAIAPKQTRWQRFQTWLNERDHG